MKMALKLIVATLIIIGLAVGAWLIAPLFYDTTVNEDLPSSDPTTKTPVNDIPSAVQTDTPPDTTTSTPANTNPVTIASGTFTDADNFHQGSGTAQLIQIDGKTYVRFAEDFSVTNGPDLFVHFGKNGQYAAEANLGKLKGNLGSQNYEVPANLDLTQYDEIWIWCRAFSVPFASAKLQ